MRRLDKVLAQLSKKVKEKNYSPIKNRNKPTTIWRYRYLHPFRVYKERLQLWK